MKRSWHSVFFAYLQEMGSIKFTIYSSAALSLAGCLFYFVFIFDRQVDLISYAQKSFGRDLETVHLGLRIKRAMVEHDALLFRYLYTRAPQGLQDLEALEQTVQESIGALKVLLRTSYLSERLDQLHRHTRGYFSLTSRIRRLAAVRGALSALDPDEKDKLFHLSQTRLADSFNLCDEFITVGRVAAENSRSAMVDRLAHMRRLALSLGLLLAATVIGLSVRLAVKIIGSLNALMDGIRRFKDGEHGILIPMSGQDEMGQVAGAFNMMVTTISEQRERLLQETITDGLTGAYNHRYFEEMIHKECQRTRRSQEPMSLLMIDMDNFKDYNDLHGHEMGNELLRRFTSAIRNQLRSSDILARYGGDEFAVLLVNTTVSQAQAIAAKIEETIAKALFPGTRSLPQRRLTLSIGGATLPDDAETPEDLVFKADEALYAAKAAGRDCIRWSGFP
jgi:diguanylate cyclase (GGDEF)-like protein